MNTDTTKKVQAAEVTFADDAFSPLPEGALDQDQIARKKTKKFWTTTISRMYGEILRRISQQ